MLLGAERHFVGQSKKFVAGDCGKLVAANQSEEGESSNFQG